MSTSEDTDASTNGPCLVDIRRIAKSVKEMFFGGNFKSTYFTQIRIPNLKKSSFTGLWLTKIFRYGYIDHI